MKKSLKKWISVMLALALCITSLTACSAKPTDNTDNNTTPPTEAAQATTAPTVAPTAAPTVTEAPAMDLGGMEIVIGDWWSAAEPAAPTNAQEEATLAYHQMIQEKYNFTMKQVGVSDWAGMQTNFVNSVVAEDPIAQVVLLQSDWVAQPMANGLLYDLTTLPELNFTDSKWNSSVLDVMTYGSSTYGMAVGKPEPRVGVFWNKRLFEEAGLDPDLPYDLQASGEWTWTKFDEICKSLVIDSNSDGTIDSYPMASFSVPYFRAFVTSNNAQFIGRDDSGKFYNATSEPEFLEAMQYATGLIEKGYAMPTPPDANWDWFTAAFHDAQVAMAFAEQYTVSTWADMTDDWGFVLPPKPDDAAGYSVYYFDNIAVIPACYDEETAKKIAFAYNLWTNPTPGYEDVTDAWKDVYYTRFRDERAVDETLSIMYDSATTQPEFLPFVYGTSFGDFAYDAYALAKTPAQKIEEVAGTWQALIDDVNK